MSHRKNLLSQRQLFNELISTTKRLGAEIPASSPLSTNNTALEKMLHRELDGIDRQLSEMEKSDYGIRVQAKRAIEIASLTKSDPDLPEALRRSLIAKHGAENLRQHILAAIITEHERAADAIVIASILQAMPEANNEVCEGRR